MSNLTDFFGSAVIQSEVFLVSGTWNPPLNINQCWVTGGGACCMNPPKPPIGPNAP